MCQALYVPGFIIMLLIGVYEDIFEILHHDVLKILFFCGEWGQSRVVVDIIVNVLSDIKILGSTNIYNNEDIMCKILLWSS